MNLRPRNGGDSISFWEIFMAIKKGDRIRHRDDLEGTAITDAEPGGTIQVKQNDGAIATWAAKDANVISSVDSKKKMKKK
jgi:hypothetical protein